MSGLLLYLNPECVLYIQYTTCRMHPAVHTVHHMYNASCCTYSTYDVRTCSTYVRMYIHVHTVHTYIHTVRTFVAVVRIRK